MIKVLLVEDMQMLRTALVALLDQEPDLDVGLAVPSGEEAMALASTYRPNVAVLDIGLPGLDGFAVAEALRGSTPCCRSLMLTSVARPGLLRRALEAGAAGMIAKDAEPAKLADAIRAVAAGQQVADPELALKALQEPCIDLTRRELEALDLAAEGDDPPQIAKRLFLSPGTVRNYLASAVTKLRARNRVDAIRIARERGWL
ncbi:response regulator transcription factor [Streptomyces olivaceiscleroticus]|uniref:Response regulator transcription factor n=1 Tax=Streptomyces olivaceiscleroticus TaxID=68245 RepID=A0ABP3L8I9_9ACTN